MKLLFRGILKQENQLPKGNLPNNAVKFNEASNIVQLYLMTLIIAAIMSIVFWVMVNLIKPLNKIDFSITNNGLLLFLFSIIPHELLHAICFGKHSEVSLYFSPKYLMAFTYSTNPISKKRFIWMSLCPTIVFGVIPLLICIFTADVYGLHDILLTFSFYSFIGGSGDYINVFNAFVQMPAESKQQMSGFNSYWFIPLQTIEANKKIEKENFQ